MQRLTSSVAGFIFALVLSACHKPPTTSGQSGSGSVSSTPAISSMSEFENGLATSASQGMHATTSDFKIIVTEAQYPVGTVMRQGSTIPIDYTTCTPDPQPSLYPFPSQFPSYTLSRAVAAGFGMDNALLSQVANAGVNITGASNVQVTIRDPKIMVMADHDLTLVLGKPACRDVIGDAIVWYVRGYIVAQRTFTTALNSNSDAKAKFMKVGNFDVDGSAGNSISISDSNPVGFLEIISEISPPPIQAAPTSPVATATHHYHARNPPPREGLAPQGTGQITISAPSASTAAGQVYVQRDLADASGDSNRVVASLRAAGLRVASGVQAIDSAKMPSTPQVRYFNAADYAVGATALRQLRSVYPDAKLVRTPLPAPAGQLEVWMAKIG